jgi:hypothetical protein
MGSLIEKKSTLMELQIPNFEKASLVNLSACGEIRPGNKGLEDWVIKHEKSWLFYHLPKPRGTVCRLGVDRFRDHLHLHLDVSTRQFFRRGKPPRPSRNAPDLGEVLTPFIGEEIQVLVSGDYSFPLAKAPPFGRTFEDVSFRQAEIGMKMTRATFSVKGLPIDTVVWEIDEKRGKNNVTTRGRTKVEFSGKYLLDCYDFINHASAWFITKTESNA